MSNNIIAEDSEGGVAASTDNNKSNAWTNYDSDNSSETIPPNLVEHFNKCSISVEGMIDTSLTYDDLFRPESGDDYDHFPPVTLSSLDVAGLELEKHTSDDGVASTTATSPRGIATVHTPAAAASESTTPRRLDYSDTAPPPRVFLSSDHNSCGLDVDAAISKLLTSQPSNGRVMMALLLQGSRLSPEKWQEPDTHQRSATDLSGVPHMFNVHERTKPKGPRNEIANENVTIRSDDATWVTRLSPSIPSFDPFRTRRCFTPEQLEASSLNDGKLLLVDGYVYGFQMKQKHSIRFRCRDQLNCPATLILNEDNTIRYNSSGHSEKCYFFQQQQIFTNTKYQAFKENFENRINLDNLAKNQNLVVRNDKPSGARLYPSDGDTPAKRFVCAAFNALLAAPRNNAGIIWSSCEIDGNWMQQQLIALNLSLDAVSPFSNTHEYDKDKDKLRNVGNIIYKASIVLSGKTSTNVIIPRDNYPMLKSFEMDHVGRKKFALSQLCIEMTSLLAMGLEGLDELLDELRACDCKWVGDHDHGTSRHYPINPFSENLLGYTPHPGELTPRQVIESHGPFRRMVRTLWEGKADQGCMPYENVAFVVYDCVGMWIMDVSNFAKDDFVDRIIKNANLHRFIGEIVSKTIKRICGPEDISNLNSFQLQAADYDHQGDKEQTPAEVHNRTIPNQLRELAKCLSVHKWRHDPYTKYNAQPELDLEWLLRRRKEKQPRRGRRKTSKKGSLSTEDSDSEVETMVFAPVPARDRSTRPAAKKVTYAFDDSDGDFEEDGDSDF